jgi:hypothetical protein
MSPTYLDVLTQHIHSTQQLQTKSLNYYISGENCCNVFNNPIQSSYKPAGLEKAFEYLKKIQIASLEPLYLVCPKYYPQKGNDVKAGISETSHIDENSFETVLRGVLEEAQIKLNEQLKPIHQFTAEVFEKKIQHYIFHLNSTVDYTHLLPPDPEVWKDNKNSKVMVYLIGTYEILSPILKLYEPFPFNKDNKKKKIDPISNLVLVPLEYLESFVNPPAQKKHQGSLKFVKCYDK